MIDLKFGLILFVVLVETLCVAAVGWGLWLLWRRFGRVQFSLRTLMIGVTVVALGLSSVSTWRYLSLARIEWLAPSSPEARQLITRPVIIPLDDGFRATYVMRFRPVDELAEEVYEEQRSGRGTWSGMATENIRHTITVESSDKADVERILSGFEKMDVLAPGWFVIRGVVRDRKGRPVPNARVEILGLSIPKGAHSQTRTDGTFTLPFRGRPDRGYLINIVYGNGEQMNTDRFTLTGDNRELVARIRVK